MFSTSFVIYLCKNNWPISDYTEAKSIFTVGITAFTVFDLLVTYKEASCVLRHLNTVFLCYMHL